jgi:aminoglycoside 3-N-acetyltransferase
MKNMFYRVIFMAVVTREDVKKAALQLGIKSTDSVIVHSSLKSLGYVEGGPDAVIDGFLDVLLPEGTLIFPTLCSNDWEHVYENWHMDAPSDVGLLTNVFRKREGALRSNQATHSVAAIGKDKVYFTETHGQSGLRPGIYGETPFAEDSPWQKMYDRNTKNVMLGVPMMYCTMRHLAEYVFVNESLKSISHLEEYEEMKEALWYYGKEKKVWPHIYSNSVCEVLMERGLVTKAVCGDATLLCVESRTFVDFCMDTLEKAEETYLWNLGICYEETVEWLKRIKELKGRKENVY